MKNNFLCNSVTKAAKKSMIIGAVLVTQEQFCGCFLLLFRAGSIFKHVNGMSPEIAAIIIGFVQIVGAYCSVKLADIAGRRIMISSSAIGVAFGLVIHGVFVQLIAHGYESNALKLCSAVGVSISIFAVNCGVFPLLYIILTEISPANVNIHLNIAFTFECFFYLFLLVFIFLLGQKHNILNLHFIIMDI